MEISQKSQNYLLLIFISIFSAKKVCEKMMGGGRGLIFRKGKENKNYLKIVGGLIIVI